MGGLNRFTAFMGYHFTPVFGKMVYKSMRSKPIVAKELKNLSALTDSRDEIHLVAHRGLSGAYPENTAPSFEAGGQNGFFALECDTHLSKDGVWMVLHDAELETMYSGSGDVKGYTYETLMQMKTCRGANIERYPDLKMCTLLTFVNICKQYGCRPVIEIKDPRPEVMQSFYDFLLENDLRDSAIIISFVLEDLQALHKIDSTLQMWYLVDYITGKCIREAVESGCCGIDFSCAFNACRPEWIQKIHDSGLLAACWTVDDREMLALMLDSGVRYITTNTILPK